MRETGPWLQEPDELSLYYLCFVVRKGESESGLACSKDILHVIESAFRSKNDRGNVSNRVTSQI